MNVCAMLTAGAANFGEYLGGLLFDILLWSLVIGVILIIVRKKKKK